MNTPRKYGNEFGQFTDEPVDLMLRRHFRILSIRNKYHRRLMVHQPAAENFVLANGERVVKFNFNTDVMSN